MKLVHCNAYRTPDKNISRIQRAMAIVLNVQFEYSISFSVESKTCCRYTQDTDYSCLGYDDRDHISRIHKEMQLKYYVSGIDMQME